MIELIENRIKEFKVNILTIIDTFSNSYSDEVKKQVKKIIEEMEYLIFLLKHHHNIKLNELTSLNFSQSRIVFTYKESGKQEVIDVFSDQDYKAFVDWWIKNKYQVVEEMATTDTKYVESSNRQLNY